MSAAKTEHHTPEFAFIALVALITALVGMSIDGMMPAMGTMAKELGAPTNNDEQLILSMFFIGNMFGIPIFGPLSDSLGRKPTIFLGMVFYLLGAIMCYAAWSFPMLLLGRVIQGFGAGGPRIISMAMVRDGHKGAQMAKVMSFVMSVFMLVPIFAPSIGQALMYFGSWRYIFLGFIIMALIASLWLGFGQEETLALENRRRFSARDLWSAAVEVGSNRISLGYTLATGLIFGVFTTYLSVNRLIYQNQYGVSDYWYPKLFGSLAISIAAAMILNGNLVQRMGMRNLSRRAMFVYAALWAVILVLGLVFGGTPPLPLLLGFFAIWFFAAGFTFGNFNAMSMEPMGHIAGMASAVIGFISQAMGIFFGVLAGRFYDGTITSIAVFFTVYAVAACALIEWAEMGRTQMKKSLA